MPHRSFLIELNFRNGRYHFKTLTLIGEDDHCWNGTGIFAIEEECYAECINLSTEIYNAIHLSSVLENGILNEDLKLKQFNIHINYIPNARLPCMVGHPEKIILLTCDAFGIIPSVAKLTPNQVMYHFISGYTTKVAGTEDGIVKFKFDLFIPTKVEDVLFELL